MAHKITDKGKGYIAGTALAAFRAGATLNDVKTEASRLIDEAHRDYGEERHQQFLEHQATAEDHGDPPGNYE